MKPQVRILQTDDIDELQTAINDWLDSLTNEIRLIDIRLSTVPLTDKFNTPIAYIIFIYYYRTDE